MKIDPRELRTAFGSFLTGVTVVTTLDAKRTPVGFTANSFSSVSLDPPLLLVCPGRFLSSFSVFEACRHFAVNILAEGQEDVSNIFASFKGDRFAEVAWRPDRDGVPIIGGVTAHFSCRTAQVVPAGDHVILVGEVLSFEQNGARGLGYGAGKYFSLGLEREAASAPRPGHRAVGGVILEHEGGVLLEETPQGLRPPQVALNSRSRVRSTICEHFAAAGAEIALGRAYSVFDDRGSDTQYTYFLARLLDGETAGLGQLYPFADLAALRLVSVAHAAMLQRYALERETQSFGLYVGDETGGDIHRFDERS